MLYLKQRLCYDGRQLHDCLTATNITDFTVQESTQTKLQLLTGKACTMRFRSGSKHSIQTVLVSRKRMTMVNNGIIFDTHYLTVLIFLYIHCQSQLTSGLNSFFITALRAILCAMSHSTHKRLITIETNDINTESGRPNILTQRVQLAQKLLVLSKISSSFITILR